MIKKWENIEELEKSIYAKIYITAFNIRKKVNNHFNGFSIFDEPEFLSSLKKQLNDYFNKKENYVDISLYVIENEHYKFFLQFRDEEIIRLYEVFVIFNETNHYPAVLLTPSTAKEYVYYYMRSAKDLQKYYIKTGELEIFVEKIYNKMNSDDLQKISLLLNLKYNIDIKVKMF